MGNGLFDFIFKDFLGLLVRRDGEISVRRFLPRRDGEISVRRFLPRRDGGKRRTGSVIGVIGRNGEPESGSGSGSGRMIRPLGLLAVLPSGLKLDILFI